MTARVGLSDGTALAFDALADSNRVLLSIEGRTTGEVLNCALIPVHTIPAVIASLEMVAKSLRVDPPAPAGVVGPDQC